MKLSLNWIQSYINEQLDTELVLERLTQAGIELESIEDVFLTNTGSMNSESDKIVEFKITPNRGDCLSAYGIAREIVGIDNYSFATSEQLKLINDNEATLKINIQEPEFCPSYFALIMQGVNNTVRTPDYILDRLNKSGIRAISAIVDIANYVMLDIGQPLHAFDMDTIGDSVTVRLAIDGEQITTLDGNELKLKSNTLIIADANNKVAAIAGVMGAMNTGVSQLTTNIVLESAFFTPEITSGRAKYYGISSDAAYRFERGVDSALQLKALTQVALLITKYCGGECGIINYSVNNSLNVQKSINLSYKKVNLLSGYNFLSQDVNNTLAKLGFNINRIDEDNCIVTVPSYRFDITIAEDLIEEILRSYGYHNIPEIMPVLSHNINDVDTEFNHINKIKNQLCDLGFNEIIAYSFQEEKIESLTRNQLDDKIDPVLLQNSIANWGVMRTSLIADLLKSYQYNSNRGHKAIKLFEIGTVFYGENIDQQPLKVSGIIGGDFHGVSWASDKREVDFFDLKNVVEILLQSFKNVEFKRCTTNSIFHVGRCANIYIGDVCVGIIGQIDPALSHEFSLEHVPYLFELDVAMIQPHNYIKINMLNKIPKQYRDLAFVLSDNINANDIITHIKDSEIPSLIDISVFDVYIGELAVDKKKSLAMRFTMQGINKTLNDDEITSSLAIIQKLVEHKFMATLR